MITSVAIVGAGVSGLTCAVVFAERGYHTTIYLDYLANRFIKGGGEINPNVQFKKLEAVDPKFDLVINCAGIGARELVNDIDLEPHRGQVAVVPKIDNLSCAIVCDDEPFM